MKILDKIEKFGGQYVPQILVPALQELNKNFTQCLKDDEFQKELLMLLQEFAGRPTPLFYCSNLSSKTGINIYLKREDLVHGGAHKTNQVIAQALLAKRMGKAKVIAETGAGQHGVATAMASALLNLECTIFMGSKDCCRQKANVTRMKLLGAKVVSVDNGEGTLKEACSEALREWSNNYEDTHYILGTVAGPAPYPEMVRTFQEVIGKEAKQQFLKKTEKLPDYIVAAIGGGSNALGIFTDFLEDESVKLIGIEPYGKGIATEQHGAVLYKGSVGILHGAKTYVLQDDEGQIRDSYSISAGLDYPGVGPEHSYLKDIGRVQYDGVTDDEAVSAFQSLCRHEGIIPALESSHALAYVLKNPNSLFTGKDVLINLSGRGDKDIDLIREYLENE